MGNVVAKGQYKVYMASALHNFHSESQHFFFMEMIGEDGSTTSLIPVDIKLENTNGVRVDAFHIEAVDIGIPSVINVEFGQNIARNSWWCEDIVIEYKNEKIRYPIHDWVYKEISVMKAKGLTFNQSKHVRLRTLRRKEIEKNKERFQWTERPTEREFGWGIPRFVRNVRRNKLPALLQPKKDRLDEIIRTGRQSAFFSEKLSRSKDFEIRSFEEYTRLYEFLEKNKQPTFSTRWQTDEEFGYQQMNGISPTSYHRCNGLPEGCQISNDHVADLLADYASLEDEIKAGKIYIADYSAVYRGVERNKGSNGEPLYCPDAVCLYYVNAEDNLVPIAIQLVPGDEDTIFTPKDSNEDWLLAKMYFKVAIGNLQQWYHNYLLTNVAMEPMAISLFRSLPRSHPVYKLLRPHLVHIPGTNDLARKILIQNSPLGSHSIGIDAEGILRKTFESFTFEDLLIPLLLKKKGLDDPDLLPKNFYRDDALELWNIIEQFVKNIIKHFYESDKEVDDDWEIQDWMKDVAREGFGWADENRHGIPEKIKSIAELVTLCTCIIFTCSVQNAAVTSPEYETYKFIPNAPLVMRLPPHRKGEGSMERIMSSLPDCTMSMTAIALTYVLSTKSSTEVYLGDYPEKYFDEPEVTKILEDFNISLEDFSGKVYARNMDLEQPYEWLLPEKIPNSITL